MLTRAQVARRLGRSIATVRRLEGAHLHPTRDVSGILRFDVAEVEAFANKASLMRASARPPLRRRANEATRAINRPLPSSDDSNGTATRLESAVREHVGFSESDNLADVGELVRIRRRVEALEEQRLAREADCVPGRSLEGGLACETLAEFVDELSGFTDRQLRRLCAQEIDELVLLLERATFER